MKDVFIETVSVARFRAAMRVLDDRKNGQSGLAVVIGQAGRGKTYAADSYYAQNGGVYLPVWQGWTQAAFLSALWRRVHLSDHAPRSSQACKTQIVAHLEKSRKTILVDEADRLHVDRIEDLRDIHEASGSPVALVGEEELSGLLSGRRRIWSRVTQEIAFDAVTPEDVGSYAMEAASLDVNPEVCNLIVKRTEGDFRLVRNMILHLEGAAKTRATASVDARMVEDVCRTRSWRRS